ncbi:MAG: MarR family winged helix-turn-helix transcriptional regulator [Tumebacillaceae bacterium]
MDEELARQLDDLDLSAQKLVRYFNRIHQEDMSRQQFLLLKTLYCKQKSTVTELAELLGLSTSATTIALNRLVKNGYINRTRDDQDRRMVWVELTPDAVTMMNTMATKRNELLGKLLSQLESEEQQTFLHLLRKMLANIE